MSSQPQHNRESEGGGAFDAKLASPTEVVAEAIALITAEHYSEAAQLYHPDLVAGQVADARIDNDAAESEADMAQLDDTEILARQLRAADPRHRFRAHLKGLAIQHPQYRDQLAEKEPQLDSLWRTVPIGHVERADRAYVVLGTSEEARKGRRKEAPDDGLAELVVLRRSADGWRISSTLGLWTGIIVRPHVSVIDADGNTIALS